MSEARSTIGIHGPDDVATHDVFQQLLADAGIPVDRILYDFDADEHHWNYTITTGDEPLHTFRPDLTAGKAHGRPIVLDNERLIFPVLHHDSYRRNPAWRDDLIHELQLLRSIATARRNNQPWFVDNWPCTCVHCRGELHTFDPQHVPYCQEHWDAR